MKEAKGVFFVGRRSDYFQRLCWEKVSPQQPSLLTIYSGNYIRCFGKRKEKDRLPTEGWTNLREIKYLHALIA